MKELEPDSGATAASKEGMAWPYDGQDLQPTWDFEFLPEDIRLALRLYAGDERALDAISTFLRAVLSEQDGHRRCAQFEAQCRDFIAEVWSRRTLDANRFPRQAKIRFDVCDRLGLELKCVNVMSNDLALSALLDQIDRLRCLSSQSGCTLHCVEEFGRPSETFISDLFDRLNASDDVTHLILCDRINPDFTTSDNRIFVFNFPSFAPIFAAKVYQYLLHSLKPSHFVFHFMTNGWRFLFRMGSKWHSHPALHMAHGVDVFELAQDDERARFLKSVVRFQPNTCITVVSNYLRDALLAQGFPEEQLMLVPNCVHERFFAHRLTGSAKMTARKQSGFDLRLVNIARAVRWKGQRELLRAVALLQRTWRIKAHLTIVCGGIGDELVALRELVDELELTEAVTFLESVDFTRTPDFFQRFDALVSASIYSNGDTARSETFGMSILEGLAAGLPVIATDAGAQPEVIGPDTAYTRTVPHGQPLAFAEALRDLFESGALDGDNIEVARDRLGVFSPQRQLDALERAEKYCLSPKLKVALISSAVDHGAGGAALRVHKALHRAGTVSHLYCRYNVPGIENMPSVILADQCLVSPSDARQPRGERLRKGYTVFSIDTPGFRPEALREIAQEADVISLHWYARFLSNADIAALTHFGKPVVFTLRDMHPLSGGCHYFHGCENWLCNCLPCPQLLPSDSNLPNAVLRDKITHWNMANVTVVTLSQHSRGLVERSPIFGGCRIETIPNPVDTQLFYPRGKDDARIRLGLPARRKIVGFLPSMSSDVKGARELFRALGGLGEKEGCEDILLITAGAAVESDIDLAIELREFSFIKDTDLLADFYSAADVLVVPSLEETFSNTALEAIACGTQVVGFATGAIAELAQDERGVAVPVGDVKALSKAILRTLNGTSADAHSLYQYAKSEYSFDKVGKSYRDLFAELAAKPVRAPTKSRSKDWTSAQPLARYLADNALVISEADLELFAPSFDRTSRLSTDQEYLPNGLDQMDMMQTVKLGEKAVRSPDGFITVTQGAAGHCVYGPYVRLMAGTYEIRIAIEALLRERFKIYMGFSQLLGEAVWDVNTVLARHSPRASLKWGNRLTSAMRFEISPEQAITANQGLEIRLWSDGRANFIIQSLLLRRL